MAERSKAPYANRSGNVKIFYEWSDDGRWVAEVGEVLSVIFQDRTKDEARANVLDGLSELLVARRELALGEAENAVNVETVTFAA